MIVLGIDPGLSGGLAAVQYDAAGMRLLGAFDIPTIGEKARRRVDALATMTIIRGFKPDRAVVERAQAMPVTGRHGAKDDEEWKGQGASSAFIYGRAVGYLECCLFGLLIPPQFVEASSWKKAHALIKSSKEDSRQRAIRLFGPHNCLARKMDHNRAESALIAWYGAMLFRGQVRSAIDKRHEQSSTNRS